MIWWIIGIIIYTLIGIFTYYKVTSKFEDSTKFEKIWYSTVWIVLIPLYFLNKAN